MKKLFNTMVLSLLVLVSVTACNSGSSPNDSSGSDTVPVTSVLLDKENMGVVAGSTGTLTATVLPLNATDRNVAWSSSNTDVAAVSDGTVTGVGLGTATITVTTDDGGYSDTCSVTVTAVPVAVTGVSLDKETLSVSAGSTGTLTAIVAPTDATDQDVTWSSSDTGVATVENGVVTGIARGTAVITVITEEGGYSDTCTVTVTEAVSADNMVLSGVSISGTAVTLSWDVVDDEDCSVIIAAYRYRGDNSSVTLSADSIGYTFTGLTAETSYTFTLTAVDTGGNTLREYDIILPTSGAGTDTTVYTVINTAAELNAVGDSADNYSGNYVLARDISLSDYSAGEGWVPIGDGTNKFTGTFFGGGHVISGLTIARSSSSYQALFGVTAGSTIKDLGISGCSISAYGYSGALVGRMYGDGNDTISNCYATGSVTGSRDNIGGLIGQNNTGAVISYCHAEVSVSGRSNVGGLAGYNSGAVSQCYATGSVSAGSMYAGGLVGYNLGPLRNCYATGSVSGYSCGGLAGYHRTSSLRVCYSTGSVSGSNYVGGFLGYWGSGTVSSCYFDTTASGTSTGVGSTTLSGITGLATDAMKNSGNYDWSFGSDQVWSIDDSVTDPVNDGYPYLTDAACVLVAVTGVSLDEAAIYVVKGSTGNLAAIIIPSNATNKQVTWSSSNTDVAAVEDGIVSGVAAGTATITATTEDGGYSDTCSVTVVDTKISVNGITLDKEDMTVNEGSTGTLTAAVEPSNATDKRITWSSSNTDVATVEDGIVTGVAAGTAVITVTTVDGGFTDTCDVTVTVAVTSVVLYPSAMTVKPGSTEALTAVVNPSDATNRAVTWESSNTGVAVVVNGIVTAISEGTAVITVTTEDGGFTDQCTVTVDDEEIIKIASFNMNILGNTKLSRTNTFTILADLATDFDIIALQEIGSNSSASSDATCTAIMNTYVAKVNEIAGSSVYSYVRGDQYAIVYRNDMFDCTDSVDYSGTETFKYTPLIANFTATMSGANFDFSVINIHTSPGLAVGEVPALKTVIEEVRILYSEEDVICLGDYNADGSYYSEGSGEWLDGWDVDTYITGIPNSYDTTVASSSNTYDRIQMTSSLTSDFTGISDVFIFSEYYDVTICEGAATTAGTEKALSDHYPVWCEYYTDRDTD